jgi:hypothetical protein
MRLLVTIPHFFRSGGSQTSDGRIHGSTAANPEARTKALTQAISSLFTLFSKPQCHFRFDNWEIDPANPMTTGQIDVLIFTTGGHQIIGRLPQLAGSIWHFETSVAPTLLGFECHSALAQRIGAYDYYAYMEDDLILHDPWFFAKLAWFNGLAGDGALLQPNRFETSRGGPVYKAYIDGDLPDHATSAFQNRSIEPVVSGQVFGQSILFARASNPHSGCFFLNARQMEEWASRADFLDRDTSFVGPLESAATLGIMRAFRVYKPTREVAAFLEIEHHGTAFLKRLGPDGRLN